MPALLPSMINQTAKINDKSLNWWSEDAIFKHNCILFSYFYRQGLKNYSQLSNIKVFIDSGGYQAISKGDYIDPLSVLRFQERHADVGFVLDKPPVRFEGKSILPIRGPELEQRAKETRKNAEIMAKNRRRSDMKLFNILHGSNFEELELWWNILKDIDLDGWAIAPKVFTPTAVAKTLAFLLCHTDKKDIHLLGSSGNSVVPVLAFVAREFDVNITFDSSAPFLAASKHFSYDLPYRINHIRLTGGNRKDITNIDDYPCQCPVCREASKVVSFNELKRSCNGIHITLVGLHNLYTRLEAIRLMYVLSADLENFRSFYRKTSIKYNEIDNAIEYLKRVHETNTYEEKSKNTLEAFT